jgi:DNA-binding transcriptional regulator YiaG
MYEFKSDVLDGVYLSNGYVRWSDVDGAGKSKRVAIFRKSKLEKKLVEHAVWNIDKLDSKLIKLFRNTLGLSQFVLATKLNIGPTTLRHYENGTANMSQPSTILLKLLFLSLKDKTLKKWMAVADDNKPFDYTGNCIKNIRNDIGLTQVEFCKLVGAKLNTLKGWENSRSEIHNCSSFILYLIENYYYDGMVSYLDDLTNIQDSSYNFICTLKKGKWLVDRGQ